jgi:serine/threonine protein kinase
VDAASVIRAVLVSVVRLALKLRCLMLGTTQKGTCYLHEHQIVHRDLKPENLIYRSEKSDDLVIADFGIAKHLESDDEMLLTVAGSPGYAGELFVIY